MMGGDLNEGVTAMAWRAVQYRCDQCHSTSPQVYSRDAYRDVQQAHWDRAHGGLMPDGERMIEVEFGRLRDVPRGQLIATVIIFGVFALILLFQH